jgi:regulator of replication initiation timing
MRNTRMIGRRIPTTKSARPQSAHQSANQSAAVQSQAPVPPRPPSVPIAIFRELSADLQATHANIESLQAENFELAAQNQQLRHNLEQLAAQTQEVVQRFRHTAIGAAADDALMLDELGFDAASATTRSQVLDQLYRALPGYAPEADVDQRPKVKLHRPQQFSSQSPLPTRFASAASDADLSGWKLTLVMGLIVFSAFGAGFLVVRPLLAPAPPR